MRKIIESIEREYRRYQLRGQGAIQQLTDPQLCTRSSPDGNSIAMLTWHLSGNLSSRFTDFLTSDGEKPWRDRESEFSSRSVTRDELLHRWNEGWDTLFGTLADIQDEQLALEVTVKGVTLDVHEALLSSLAHASYHVGQIVLIARHHCGSDWQWLSVPPRKSS